MLSHVTSSHKELNEILKKFAEESIRIAVQNVDRKRDARATANEKFSTEKGEKERESLDTQQVKPLMKDIDTLSRTHDNSTGTTNHDHQNEVNNYHHSPDIDTLSRTHDNPTGTTNHDHQNEVNNYHHSPDIDTLSRTHDNPNGTTNHDHQNEVNNYHPSPDKTNTPDDRLDGTINQPSNPYETIQSVESEHLTTPQPVLAEELSENIAEKFPMDDKENLKPKQDESDHLSSSSYEGDEIFSLSECLSTQLSPVAVPSALYYRKGSMLHKDVDLEDKHLVEIREVLPNGRIKVTLGERNSDQSARDERWVTNILDTLGSLKADHQNFEEDDPIFHPPYSKRYTPPRKSAAATHLE
nr:uncharacterized protein LOC107453936 [Parasteatoda tepidariorum]